MNKWLLTTLIAAGASVALGQDPAPGRGPEAGPGPGGHPFMGRMMDGGRPQMGAMMQRGADMLLGALASPETREKLGVSEEQVAKLKELRQDTEKRMIDLRADVEKAHLTLRSAMQAEAPDVENVEKAIDAALKAENAVRKAELLTMVKAEKIVGPEATKKIREHAAERMRTAMQRNPQGGGPNPQGGPFQRGRALRDAPAGGPPQGGDRPWQRRPMAPPEDAPKRDS
jgi:hypothetical protein